MLNFDYFMPTRIVFGPGRLAELENTADLPTGGRAMIVIGAGGAMLREGYLARVQGLLAARGVATLVCDCIPPHPDSATIDAAADQAREKAVDFIVGLGGGSTLDAAKAIAFASGNPGPCWNCAAGARSGDRTPDKPGLPLVAIPTTAGAGSEVGSGCLITRSGHAERIVWTHPAMFPVLAVVDPDLTLSVPAATTAHTGMDALFRAVGALLGAGRQPVSDLLALEAIQIIGRYLPTAVADGGQREARTLLMWASTAAGICAALSSGLPLQALAITIGTHVPDLPHGVILTRLAGPYFKWLGKANPRRFDLLAAALGPSGETDGNLGPADFDAALQALVGAVGLADASTGDLGWDAAPPADLVRAAFDTMGAQFTAPPAPMTPAEAEALLAVVLDR